MIKKVCVILVDRANYGRLKPVMQNLKTDKRFSLQIICTGTTLLEKYGNVSKLIEKDGFKISSKIYMEYSGSVPETMAMGIGTGIILLTNEINKLNPDVVLLIGDRYEALSAAIASAYNNKIIAHVQGGEVSGSIDESARHAITKFSHLHFPSTLLAKERIIRMGEDPNMVICSGCPSKDLIDNSKLDIDNLNINGVGKDFDITKPFFLVSYHPTTTIVDQSDKKNIQIILKTLSKIKKQVLWIWPNIDAGSDSIAKQLRCHREANPSSKEWLTLIKNVNPEIYMILMKKALCLIGNSSSFVRDSSFIGTPSLIVSNRQINRERGNNSIYLGNLKYEKELSEKIDHVIEFKNKKFSNIYGQNKASQVIVDAIYDLNPQIQKTFYL
tara:strand:+ start:261 stop:1415 length:1155 start_codon:yes stop_codon:yes gene_type:complete